jgi:hypothetical protein
MTTEEEIYKLYLEHYAAIEKEEGSDIRGPIPRSLSAAIGQVIDQKFIDLDARLNDVLHRMQDPNG